MLNIVKYSEYKDNNDIYLLPQGTKYFGISLSIHNNYKDNHRFIYLKLQKSLKLTFVGALNNFVNEGISRIVIPFGIGEWGSLDDIEELRKALLIIDKANDIEIIGLI